MVIYSYLPLQEPPKFTQIVIFGLKINYLATLARMFKNQNYIYVERDIKGWIRRRRF
jgi:hypothetical protein